MKTLVFTKEEAEALTKVLKRCVGIGLVDFTDHQRMAIDMFMAQMGEYTYFHADYQLEIIQPCLADNDRE